MWCRSLRSASIFLAAIPGMVKGVELGIHCWLRHAIDGFNMNALFNQEARQYENHRNSITTIDNSNQWGLVFAYRPEKRFLLI